MGLFDRFRRPAAHPEPERGLWWPDSTSFAFNGIGYGGPQLVQTSPGGKAERIDADFVGYVRALQACPPAFAAQVKRARYLSQATFTWRDVGTKRSFGTTALEILERPWQNGTSAELVSKMEWHEGMAGNAFVWHNRPARQLRVLRPDWVTIVVGSHLDADDAVNQLDAEVLGYVYCPGGLASGNKPTALLPEDVAHWAPLPDPLAAFRGMSWLTPLIREIQGDILTAEHKIRFFENGATPNLVVKGIPAATADQFKELVALMEDQHAGVSNAYRTLYLSQGADATVVGADLSGVSFKEVQGAGETRMAVVGEVPASLLGISEGMQGSSLNAGNYSEARRSLTDGWLTSTLQSLVGCLGQVVTPPRGGQLWYSTADMPLMREDAKVASEVRKSDAVTLRNLLDAGYEPDAAVEFVQSGDLAKLAGKHSGLFSVQLQKPGEKANTSAPSKDSDDPAP